MPKVLYRVTLTQEERTALHEIATRGKHGSQKVLNALILLGCDEGTFQECKQTAARLTEVLPISMKKVDRVKRRFVEHGLEVALDKRKADRQHMKKVDGDFEARLIALSCGKPPQGHARWSLRLLADKVVELEYIDSISRETVRRVLKKRVRYPRQSRGLERVLAAQSGKDRKHDQAQLGAIFNLCPVLGCTNSFLG